MVVRFAGVPVDLVVVVRFGGVPVDLVVVRFAGVPVDLVVVVRFGGVSVDLVVVRFARVAGFVVVDRLADAVVGAGFVGFGVAWSLTGSPETRAAFASAAASTEVTPSLAMSGTSIDVMPITSGRVAVAEFRLR